MYVYFIYFIVYITKLVGIVRSPQSRCNLRLYK